jgi:hypothetical protein
MDVAMSEPHIDAGPSPAPLPVQGKRRRLRSILLGMVILLAGIAIGSGVTLFVVHRLVLHAIHHPEEAPYKVSSRLQSKLDLTDAQTATIRDIVAGRQKHIQAIRREAQPKVQRELEAAREDIAAVLNPDQAKRFREQFDRLRNRWMPTLPPPPGSDTGSNANRESKR